MTPIACSSPPATKASCAAATAAAYGRRSTRGSAAWSSTPWRSIRRPPARFTPARPREPSSRPTVGSNGIPSTRVWAEPRRSTRSSSTKMILGPCTPRRPTVSSGWRVDEHQPLYLRQPDSGPLPLLWPQPGDPSGRESLALQRPRKHVHRRREAHGEDLSARPPGPSRCRPLSGPDPRPLLSGLPRLPGVDRHHHRTLLAASDLQDGSQLL